MLLKVLKMKWAFRFQSVTTFKLNIQEHYKLQFTVGYLHDSKSVTIVSAFKFPIPWLELESPFQSPAVEKVFKDP